MKYEVLKRSHVKRNILIAIVLVAIISAIVLNFTQAKYRTTQSIPLIQGTINYSPSDLNLMAVYLNKNGDTISSDKVPHVGYTLNTEQSICEVHNIKDETIEIVYENGLLNFNGLGNKGTKCTAYFDLIPDNENPILNNIYFSTNDTSITATASAIDNIGIYYYYYKIDNEEEVRSEEESYTFEGLTKGSNHTISVRVEDAAGNISSTLTNNSTVGLTAKEVILANEGGAISIESKGIPNFNNTATTDEGMYAAEDDYGTSYYYRGAVQDNWVKFGINSDGQDMYWRIVRINGDGTVRLVYNGTTTNQIGAETQIQTSTFNISAGNNMYVGYIYELNEVHGLKQPSIIKGILDIWYQNNLDAEEEYIEGSTGFCGDRTPSTSESSSNGSGGTGNSTTYYGAYIRISTNKSPILICSNASDLYTTSTSNQGNQALKYPIGLITADEVAMAGGTIRYPNQSYYLYNEQTYWTISPYYYHSSAVVPAVFGVNMAGYIVARDVGDESGIRPVINLKADVSLTGTGTSTDPFQVVGAS